MNLLILRILSDHSIHEAQEFSGTAPWEAIGHHFSGLHIQRREQVRRPVPEVVMSPLLGLPEIDRQDRLRTVQCLHLRLLVTGEHDSTLRRIQIQAHNVGHLGLEIWIGRKLERTGPMRLEIMLTPQLGYVVVRYGYSFFTLQVVGHPTAGLDSSAVSGGWLKVWLMPVCPSGEGLGF